MFSKKATNIDKILTVLIKSLLSIWRYVVNVKLTVKISLNFVAFLENMNFAVVKSKGKISQNFEAFSEYMNFSIKSLAEYQA